MQDPEFFEIIIWNEKFELVKWCLTSARLRLIYGPKSFIASERRNLHDIVHFHELTQNYE